MDRAKHANTKTYEDGNGQRVELDPNDPATQDRVSRGELREVTDPAAGQR